jgi:hypothetical protein
MKISASSCVFPSPISSGADLTYTFMAMNGLMHWGDQKYKLEEQIRAITLRSRRNF